MVSDLAWVGGSGKKMLDTPFGRGYNHETFLMRERVGEAMGQR